MTVVGPLTLGVHDWASPQPGQPVMFNHAFIEWFTGTRPRTVALIFLPSSAYLVWVALAAGWSPTLAAILFAMGMLLWTFAEYLIHRFVFHPTPRGRLGVLSAYLIHGVHHAFPEDRRRWLMPPVVSVPIAAGLYGGVRLMIGSAGPPVFAGFLFGYLAYDLLHYACHAGGLRGRVPRYLRQHHLTHHYRAPESGFGVSSPLWDRVFVTLTK